MSVLGINPKTMRFKGFFDYFASLEFGGVLHHWLEFQDLLQKAVPNNFADRNEVQCLLIFILCSMKEIAQETMKGGVTETGRD